MPIIFYALYLIRANAYITNNSLVEEGKRPEQKDFVLETVVKFFKC